MADRRTADLSGLFAQLTPAPWLQAGTWEFQVFNSDEQSLGSVVLYFTAIAADDFSCSEGRWWRADIVSDNLDYDFGFELKPAYRLHGPWLTVDLTSTICGAGHLLDGEMKGDTATGFFNYSHKLGGENLGTFIAKPFSGEVIPAGDSRDTMNP